VQQLRQVIHPPLVQHAISTTCWATTPCGFAGTTVVSTSPASMYATTVAIPN